ncbi:DAGAT-domain-containing protein [Choiromyces venosus 120613-1]|uniref:Diacylglycerol O-acyltransferase n=1 Tax=Choiromyces venosus 120613-1 TaxID=1336337 RepID=A0A3N4JBS9_9PEZI|nr:DAGAT-domain-containing protein [Choiromyces venosus 120613-1]
MEAGMQPHTEEDIPSSSSEDGFDSLTPAPIPKELPKSYAATAVEPPPPKDRNDANRDGEVAGKVYASAIVKPPVGRGRGNGVKLHQDDDNENREPMSPQKTGESSTSSDRHETNDKASKEEKTRLVSGDYANNRRIYFAPLKIPLKRRLQTAAVLWHTFAIAIFFSLFWFLLAIPLTWPLLVPYLIYVLFSSSHRDGSSPVIRSSLFRSLPMWRLLTAYFPLNLHRSSPLPPDRNYIFTYHPHGIISHGAFGHFCTEGTTGFEKLFPGIKNTLLTLESNFRIPFYREYLLKLGLASVSRRSCEALLRGEGETKRSWLAKKLSKSPLPQPSPGGRAITIVVGGAQESLEAIPGTMKLVLKRRRGFLKIAIRENAGVVPVLSFGENDLYDQMVPSSNSLIKRLQMLVKKTAGFTVPLFHARGVFNYDVGFLPYRKEVNTVGTNPLPYEVCRMDGY